MDSPGDWRRRAGRPRQSWLRTMVADLRPMNLGLPMAKRRAQDRSAWRGYLWQRLRLRQAPEEEEEEEEVVGISVLLFQQQFLVL